jgi:hypothetical protein
MEASMAEIREVDIAWEALITLREVLCSAVATVEQMGGRDPSEERPTDAAVKYRHELRARCQQVIAVLLTPNLTLVALIDAYKQTAAYRKLDFKSRGNYDAHMHRIQRAYGELPLKNVTAEDLEKWRVNWSGDGKHPAMAHAAMSITRLLLRFGVRKFGDDNCARLAVHFPRFKKDRPSARKRINATQLVPFCANAHKMGLHTLALAVAIQCEAKLSEKQLIGCWVPLAEPGSSNLVRKGQKWLGGLDWAQIDSDRILRLPAGPKEVEIDLKLLPMVMEELNRLAEIPDSGPMIVSEKSELPYLLNAFTSCWRRVANAAGIPKDVFNTCHQKRERPAVPLNKEQVWGKVTPICSSIPEIIRDDVRQQMIRDVLDGKITIEQLPAAKKQYAAEQWKLQNRYTLSLDQTTIAGRRLGDSISSDHNTWRQT